MNACQIPAIQTPHVQMKLERTLVNVMLGILWGMDQFVKVYMLFVLCTQVPAIVK